MMAETLALEPLARQNTVLLTTFRRDGTPVGTPVHLVVEGDRAFVRTFDSAGKLKRIRNTPVVEVAPSTIGGTPIGPAIRACEGARRAGSRARQPPTGSEVSDHPRLPDSARPSPARQPDDAHRADPGRSLNSPGCTEVST